MDLGGDVSTAATQWRKVTKETIFCDLNLKLRSKFLRIYNFFTKKIYQIKKYLFCTGIFSDIIIL